MLHVAGQGHHPSHKNRAHPYSGAALTESRSHHHLSSLGAPSRSASSSTAKATSPSTSVERSTAEGFVPTEAEDGRQRSAATSPVIGSSENHGSSSARPNLLRNNSSNFGPSGRSLSGLSLSAYHLSGPVPDPRKLVKESAGAGRTTSDSYGGSGARSVGGSRTHLPSLADEQHQRSSRHLPGLAHLHSVANGHHHQTHAHNFHPYGGHGHYRDSKRSASRSAPASRAASPHGSPRLSHAPLPGTATGTHSRRSSAGRGVSPTDAAAATSNESSPSSQHKSVPRSVGSSPTSSFAGVSRSRHVSPTMATNGGTMLPPMQRSHSSSGNNAGNGSSGGSKPKSLFAMTPIHAGGSGGSGPSSPPNGRAFGAGGTTLPPISSIAGGGNGLPPIKALGDGEDAEMRS